MPVDPSPADVALDVILLGCDFSSSPSRKKPIVLALGALRGGRVVLSKLERLESLAAFALWLQQPGLAPLIFRSDCHAN
jgi:hypothetical protein